jgi:membrane-associated phospholipid phosphatase
MKKFFLIVCSLGIVSSLRADLIETAGNVLVYAIPVATIGIILCHKDFRGLEQYGFSALMDEGLTFGLKYTVHELRPNCYDRHSFPSGHSSTTFTAAEFLWKRYNWKFGVPAYALAAFTGYSRIKSKWHYTHDIIAGAALGILSSYIFTKSFNVELITYYF